MAHTGWVVVAFINDESVAEVPSDWVVGGFCYWPPYKPSRMTLAIKNCELCDESWEKLAVAVFPGGICYDYATVRAKARKAEQTRNLQSDVEATKRKIIPKRYSSCVESGPERTPLMSPPPQMEDFSGQRTQSLPPPPKMRKTVIRSDETAAPSTSHGSQGSFSGAMSQVENVDAGLSGSSNSNTTMEHQLKILIEQNNKIIGQNNLLRTLLLETMERVRTLETKLQPLSSTQEKQSFFIKYQHLQFPLNSMEKMQELEDILKEDNNFQDAITEFARYGGATIYDFTKRVLSSTITNDLALQYSWLGRQAKEPFYKLKVTQVVIGAAEKSKLESTRKDAEVSIQKWLKRACDRKKKIIIIINPDLKRG